jgi:hypothetical protein
MFKDEGWDQASHFTTYKDLLEEAKVRVLACKIKVNDAN